MSKKNSLSLFTLFISIQTKALNSFVLLGQTSNTLGDKSLEIGSTIANPYQLETWMHIAHLLFLTIMTFLIVMLLLNWIKRRKLNEKMVHFIQVVYDLQRPIELMKGPLEELTKDENFNEVQKSKINVAMWSASFVQSAVSNLIEQEKSDKLFHHILKSAASKRINLNELIDSKFISYKQQKDALEKFNPDMLPGKETLTDQIFMEKLVSTLKTNIENTDFNIDNLCQEIGMSRSSLYHRIKSITGMAPADFVRLYRLEKAKELLALHQYTISEVAYKTGFSDVKYFRTVFKKQYQTAPKSFSRQQ